MTAKRSAPDAGLGEFIRRQRELGHLSLRQLADACGVSNAYLSQIERGLRTPSSFVLKALADGLEMSSETLYAQAGILDPTDSDAPEVVEAIRQDAYLSARQREMLVDMYESFRKVNDATQKQSRTKRKMVEP
jgi:transcriptional regulator with XRE-family HTH domain